MHYDARPTSTSASEGRKASKRGYNCSHRPNSPLSHSPFLLQYTDVLSGVKTFLLSFKNHSQNVLLLTPKLHCGTIFQPAIPETRNVFTLLYTQSIYFVKGCKRRLPMSRSPISKATPIKVVLIRALSLWQERSTDAQFVLGNGHTFLGFFVRLFWHAFCVRTFCFPLYKLGRAT